MPRPTSERVASLKRDLLHRVEHGYLRPGDRFYSNRQLAQQFGVSYQTADRIIRELCQAGTLHREKGSGTYVSGRSQIPERADLIFSPRAQTADSFGSHLLSAIEARLQRLGLPYRVRWATDRVRLFSQAYPVIWESPAAKDRLLKTQAFGLLLNNRPPPGSHAQFVDTVEVDDFSGGALAGETFRKLWRIERPCVFAGPKGDARSQSRLDGFRSVYPRPHTFHSRSWHYQEALKSASHLLDDNYDGIFCANDRLAQAAKHVFTASARPLPRILGFDHAPIARREGISSIAIPWTEFAEEVADRIKRRLSGDNGTARRLTLAPRLVV